MTDGKKFLKRSGGYIGEDTFNTYGFMQNHLLALTMGVMNETSTFIPIPKNVWCTVWS